MIMQHPNAENFMHSADVSPAVAPALETRRFDSDVSKLSAELASYVEQYDQIDGTTNTFTERLHHIVGGHAQQQEVGENAMYEIIHLLAFRKVENMWHTKDALLHILEKESTRLSASANETTVALNDFFNVARDSSNDNGSINKQEDGNNSAIDVISNTSETASPNSDSEDEPDYGVLRTIIDLLTLCVVKAFHHPFMTEADLDRIDLAVGSLVDIQVPLLKLLSVAAAATAKKGYDNNIRIQVTYKAMRIVSRVLKNGDCKTDSAKWALLESFNVIKDTCPHGNVFQPASLTLLEKIHDSNVDAYENVIRWNRMDWAVRGDALCFVRADHDDTRIDRRRQSVLGVISGRRLSAVSIDGKLQGGSKSAKVTKGEGGISGGLRRLSVALGISAKGSTESVSEKLPRRQPRQTVVINKVRARLFYPIDGNDIIGPSSAKRKGSFNFTPSPSVKVPSLGGFKSEVPRESAKVSSVIEFDDPLQKTKVANIEPVSTMKILGSPTGVSLQGQSVPTNTKSALSTWFNSGATDVSPHGPVSRLESLVEDQKLRIQELEEEVRRVQKPAPVLNDVNLAARTGAPVAVNPGESYFKNVDISGYKQQHSAKERISVKENVHPPVVTSTDTIVVSENSDASPATPISEENCKDETDNKSETDSDTNKEPKIDDESSHRVSQIQHGTSKDQNELLITRSSFRSAFNGTIEDRKNGNTEDIKAFESQKKAFEEEKAAFAKEVESERSLRAQQQRKLRQLALEATTTLLISKMNSSEFIPRSKPVHHDVHTTSEVLRKGKALEASKDLSISSVASVASLEKNEEFSLSDETTSTAIDRHDTAPAQDTADPPIQIANEVSARRPSLLLRLGSAMGLVNLSSTNDEPVSPLTSAETATPSEGANRRPLFPFGRIGSVTKAPPPAKNRRKTAMEAEAAERATAVAKAKELEEDDENVDLISIQYADIVPNHHLRSHNIQRSNQNMVTPVLLKLKLADRAAMKNHFLNSLEEELQVKVELLENSLLESERSNIESQTRANNVRHSVNAELGHMKKKLIELEKLWSVRRAVHVDGDPIEEQIQQTLVGIDHLHSILDPNAASLHEKSTHFSNFHPDREHGEASINEDVSAAVDESDPQRRHKLGKSRKRKAKKFIMASTTGNPSHPRAFVVPFPQRGVSSSDNNKNSSSRSMNPNYTEFIDVKETGAREEKVDSENNLSDVKTSKIKKNRAGNRSLSPVSKNNQDRTIADHTKLPKTNGTSQQVTTPADVSGELFLKRAPPSWIEEVIFEHVKSGTKMKSKRRIRSKSPSHKLTRSVGEEIIRKNHNRAYDTDESKNEKHAETIAPSANKQSTPRRPCNQKSVQSTPRAYLSAFEPQLTPSQLRYSSEGGRTVSAVAASDQPAKSTQAKRDAHFQELLQQAVYKVENGEVLRSVTANGQSPRAKPLEALSPYLPHKPTTAPHLARTQQPRRVLTPQKEPMQKKAQLDITANPREVLVPERSPLEKVA
jgi:hypothetical protein